ncbi:MAG: LytR C-terminal domain-containing protein [Gemmatimonadota bacterium]
MNRRVLLIVGGIVALVAITAGVVRSRTSSPNRSVPQRPTSNETANKVTSSLTDPKWATGTRITVEVLNATKVRGLARRAALALRDRGFDVVSTGTNRDGFDSTKVLDRTGHRDWAAQVAKAMGGATVLERPDSSRDVDVTVLIGGSWHPPSQPFYP